MLAHVSGKHRGGEKVQVETELKEDDTETSVQQLTSCGRIKRKAASLATRKVVQAFKDIDASIDVENSTENKDMDGIGDGDNLDDEEYNVASELDSKDIRKMYYDSKLTGQKAFGSSRFSCVRCKYKSHNRFRMEEHVIKKHSNETIEILSDEEEIYVSDDQLLEEEIDAEEEDEIYEYSKRTPSKKSKSCWKPILGKDATSKAPPLYHDKEMIKDELKFRELNFCKDGTLFPDFHTSFNDWIHLEPTEYAKYLPNRNEPSIPFKVDKMENDIPNSHTIIEKRQLNSFDSCIDKDDMSFTIYTGGPIWAGDWCPLSEYSGIKYDVVALSVDMDFKTETKLSYDSTHNVSLQTKRNSLLQLWSCELQRSKSSKDLSPKPKMKVGIVHDFGKIWCLKWCPSGCENIDINYKAKTNSNYLPRLGLLAAACSDGSVRIFSIPTLCNLVSENDECSLYKVRSSSLLTLSHSGINLKDRTSNPACLSLSWFKGRGHRVIAGAYTDGNISIWDIETKSVLLKTQNDSQIGTILYPYMFFRAHLTGVKISLDFSTESLDNELKIEDEDENLEDCFFPRYLATGSSDRVFAVWDLSDGATAGSMGSIVPIRQFRRHFIRY